MSRTIDSRHGGRNPPRSGPPLNPDLGRFGYPRWAPDGRSVSVEEASKDGRLGIYRVDVQTGDVVPIVQIDKGMEICSHRWSKDGKRLYYAVGDRAGKTSSVFIHNFQTGQEERLSGSPSNAHDIDISPDGKWLVLLNRERKGLTRIMPTSGGEPREISSFEQEGNHIMTPAWSADGRYIYFSKLQKFPGDMQDLYRVSVDGGEAQKIDLAMARFRHLGVPSSSWPAFCYFELTLTSDHAAIYHPQRWDESRLAHECSFSQRSRKGNYYLSLLS